MPSLVDLATAKSWLPHLVEALGPSAPGMNDEDLQRYIDAATVTAERVAGRGLAARDRTEILSGIGTYWLSVSAYPVQSITSIKISGTGDFEAAETVTDYELEAESGMLYRRALWPEGSRNIQISYNGGYGLPAEAPGEDPDYLVPDDLTRAVCEVIDWMWQRDRNQTIGIRTTIGADGLQTSYSLDVPLSARSVFESYREVRV
jgi:hypothetical protein